MKNIIPWSKDLETGIELIDSQHKQFLKNANTFIIKVRAKKEVDAALEELQFLENYLLYHFQAEEAFQYESNFPDYLNHQALHKHLTFRVREMSTLLKISDFSNESIDSLCGFINDWVVGHILHEDMKFSHFYNALKNE